MTALAADARSGLSRGARRIQRVLFGWWLLALAAFSLLPWYFPQDLSMGAALLHAFGGSATASGLLQASMHGRPWLWVVALALRKR